MKSLVPLLAYVLLFANAPAWAFMLPGQPVTVDRLVKNSEQMLEEHPNDVGRLYALARVHYLASRVSG